MKWVFGREGVRMEAGRRAAVGRRVADNRREQGCIVTEYFGRYGSRWAIGAIPSHELLYK